MAFLRRYPSALMGSLRRRSTVGDVTALRQPDLRRPPSAPAPALSRRYQSTGYRAKKLLLGPALKTSQLSNERVSKRVALAVFSSDPISSTAYATEEMLLVLVGAALATRLALPVALAIVVPLALLVDYVLTVAVSVSSGVVAVGAMVAAGLWRLAGRDIELSPDPCRGSSLPHGPPRAPVPWSP